jgi:spore maturation protein CgeB/SAM-dependent methyltransferase
MSLDLINEPYYGNPADAETEHARRRTHWICGQVSGRNVLDIGCGQGIAALIIGREGFQCAGIDCLSAAVERAQQALAKEEESVRHRVRFQRAEASQLPFDDESFDTVILGHVLHQLTQPATVLREAKRVARQGGRLVLTVPWGLSSLDPLYKQPVYPISLLQMLQPFFGILSTDALGDDLVCVGVKPRATEPDLCCRDDLLREYLRLGKALEARCLEREWMLLALKTKGDGEANTAGSVPVVRRDEPRQHPAPLAAKEGLARQVNGNDGLARASAAALCGERSAAHSMGPRWEGTATEDGATQDWRQHVAALQAENRALREQLTVKTRELKERERLHDIRLREREEHLRGLAGQREAEWKRRAANECIRSVARAALPPEAQVLVISHGDDEMLQLDGRRGWHFPQAANGVYAGHHPGTASEAVEHLESLKAKGAQFLLIPSTSMWWLDFYGEFAKHLEKNYRVLAYHEGACVIYSLAPGLAECGAAFGMAGRNGAGMTRPLTPPKGSGAGAVAAVNTVHPGAAAEACVPASGAPNSGATNHTGPRLALGAILDEFTMGCLQPECHLITFRPDNWKQKLERERPAALFVESAWRGNEGAWLYRVASYQRDMGNELAEMLEWARQQGIPSVFWNKEDPVHFERFIQRARLFSHIFTTDADCVARYREKAGHERVFALPFAAQPSIHNPVQTEPREGAVCFAGTYYGDRHEQRQADMEYILRPAIPFGLEIYDRQHGVVGKNSEAYRFPDIYESCIRGRLDYEEMVKAYKRYRVFLNVNSVKQSPTMFSRRVFELLASGTPVISTYSRAIVELLGEDIVFITETEAETRRHLEKLLGDEGAWARASVRGIRKVLREHTYQRRMQEVAGQVGIASARPAEPRISVVIRVKSAAEIECLASILEAQAYWPFELLLLSKGELPAHALELLRNGLPNVPVKNILGLPGGAHEQCMNTQAEYLAFLDLRDSYGPNYLMDYALAASYSGADFIGKHTIFQAGSNGGHQLQQSGQEFKSVTSVQSATVMAKKPALSRSLFEQMLNSRVFKTGDRQILSIDRFNYVQNAFGGEIPQAARAREASREMEVHV